MRLLIFALIPFNFLIMAYSNTLYEVDDNWLKLEEGRSHIGSQHGDIAISANGDIYISTEDPEASLQVYNAEGIFKNNIERAPNDLHGFIIHQEGEEEFIYGAGLLTQVVYKMTLDGQIVMSIGSAQFPAEHKVEVPYLNATRLLLTSVVVASSGDLYVADGYASYKIHRFSKSGQYISSFGGKEVPYEFNMPHKLAIDHRFKPERLIVTDRVNNRVVHLSIDGEMLGVVAQGLRLPDDVVIYGDNAIISEYDGRISVLDINGKVIERMGTNDGEGKGQADHPPEKWETGVTGAPHGVAVNSNGDLFVSEHSEYGRAHRFRYKPADKK